MNEADALDIVQAAIWTVVVASGPPVLAAMAVGLIVALVQALTQVQEMTLTFVPKVAAILAVFWVGMSFMTEEMVTFFQSRILVMIAGS